MALGRAFSVAVRGLEGEIVEIEADITSGLPGVHLVGLPDTALQESRDRVRAAITNCGNSWPMARLTLALSPATLPKMGSVYDLALACRGAVGTTARRRGSGWKRRCCSASWRWTGGCARSRACCPRCWPPSARAGRRWWFPSTTWREASLVDGIEVLGAPHTGAVARRGCAGKAQLDERIDGADRRRRSADVDLADVVGQIARRGSRVEVAAAGAHHLMLTGPPGVGKTMLAQRLPGLLPPLSHSESLEVTAIHSVAGTAVGRHAADHPTAVRGAASHVERGRAGRRRLGDGAAGCGQPRTPGRAVSRRVRRRSAPARWRRCELRWRTARSGSPGATVWPGIRRGSSWCWRPTRARVRRTRPARLHLHADRQAPISGQAVGPAAGPCGSACRSCTASGRERSLPRQASRRRWCGNGWQSARDAAAERWRQHGMRTNAEVSGVLLRRRFRLEQKRDGTAGDGGRPWPAQHPWRRQDICGSRGRSRTWPGANVAGARRGRHSTELPAGAGGAR